MNTLIYGGGGVRWRGWSSNDTMNARLVMTRLGLIDIEFDVKVTRGTMTMILQMSKGVLRQL
jgi:hypothetical protein